MLKAIGDFLFGKDAKIFNKKGQVEHNLGESKWSAWDHRFDTDKYDWKDHKGRHDKSHLDKKRSEKQSS